MTTGIYLLEFKGTSAVYVGQAVNIEKRFREHLLSFRKGTANYKLMSAYTTYGNPILKVILECCIKELNDAEMEAMSVFDSITKGFNIAKYSDIFQCGDKNPASKYSTEVVEQVFFLLLDPKNNIASIAKLANVNESLVRHIANGDAHQWLKEKYPEKYPILRSIIINKDRRKYSNSAEAKGIVYPKIEKDGIVKEVTSIAQFARENNLDPSYLGKVLRGQYTSCKGWKVVRQ